MKTENNINALPLENAMNMADSQAGMLNDMIVATMAGGNVGLLVMGYFEAVDTVIRNHGGVESVAAVVSDGNAVSVILEKDVRRNKQLSFLSEISSMTADETKKLIEAGRFGGDMYNVCEMSLFPVDTLIQVADSVINMTCQ